MTPDEARALLDGTTPGDEWYYRIKGGGVSYVEPVTVIPGGEVDVTEEDAALIVAAPEMAAMIAGMRAEYAVELELDGGQWYQVTGWSHEPPLNDGHILAPDERIVRRYVTTPEEI